MNPFTRQFYAFEDKQLSEDKTITTLDFLAMNAEIQKMFSKDQDIAII